MSKKIKAALMRDQILENFKGKFNYKVYHYEGADDSKMYVFASNSECLYMNKSNKFFVYDLRTNTYTENRRHDFLNTAILLLNKRIKGKSVSTEYLVNIVDNHKKLFREKDYFFRVKYLKKILNNIDPQDVQIHLTEQAKTSSATLFIKSKEGVFVLMNYFLYDQDLTK